MATIRCLIYFVYLNSFFLNSNEQKSIAKSNNNNSSVEPHFQWGTVFGGVTSEVVKLNCTLNDSTPVCCSTLSEKATLSYKDLSDRDIFIIKSRGKCITTRVYISSPYERRHYLKAREIGRQSSFSRRKNMLISFLSSPNEVLSAQRWMNRVKLHMNSNISNNGSDRNRNHSSIEYTYDDFEYLSYFNVTRHCHGNRSNRSWIEWIEPLSMHTRDPFSLSKADKEMNSAMERYPAQKESNPPLQSNNYVLLQNGAHMSQYELGDDHRIRRNSKYMLDTGTSRFDSSLWWFTCGYAQRGIELNQLFGWEVTLMEPNDFWRKVPPRWRQSYHFFNTPISSDPSNEWHPLRFIQAMGIRESDFVSFKLDIDTVDVELPIALELLTNPEFSSLIDEFFFELHFKCEIMHGIWGDKMPDTFGFLKLARAEVLAFFGALRRNGIRAHFWP